jgi:hypothetical protein
MKASESPYDFSRIDTDNFPCRETGLNYAQSLIVFVAPEGGNDDRMIGNIEISIRAGQALVFVEVFGWHGQFHYIQLFAIDEAHLF